MKKLTRENYYSPSRGFISTSQINDYLRSPSFYFRKHILKIVPDRDTESMRIGKAVDALLTGYGEQYEKKVLKRDNPELYEKQQTTGAALLSDAAYEKVQAIVAFVKTQPFWSVREAKESITFQLPLTSRLQGVPVCGLLDRLDLFAEEKRARVVDLKVTSFSKIASPQRWLWNCRDSGYFRQAAMYRFLVVKKYKINPHNVSFYHAVAAADADNVVKVELYKAPETEMEIGMTQIQSALLGIKLKKFDDHLIGWEDAVSLENWALNFDETSDVSSNVGEEDEE